MPDLDKLLELLKESKREHYHCDDSWYCCRACRHPDHMLAEGENIGSSVVGGLTFEPGVCTCGASEWNAKVDAALQEPGKVLKVRSEIVRRTVLEALAASRAGEADALLNRERLRPLFRHLYPWKGADVVVDALARLPCVRGARNSSPLSSPPSAWPPSSYRANVLEPPYRINRFSLLLAVPPLRDLLIFQYLIVATAR